MNKLQYAKGIFGQEEKDAVIRALDSGWLSNGMETLEFEKEFAEWWGVKYALSVNSGSSANLCAMQSLGLQRGDEVITPAGGAFPTTVAPMIYLGLKPVFVDIKGLTLDLDEVEKAISPKTKALVFAHTLGSIADMDRVWEIAKKYDLKVMADTCDALGSKYKGSKAGIIGDVSTVSFYPAHHMTTGEGGMVVTNSYRYYREALAVRDWGRDCICRMDRPAPVCRDRWSNPGFDHRYYYTRIGLNLKMNEMTAAFGRAQLARLDGFIELRKRNYKILAEALGEPYDNDISPFCYVIYSKNRANDMRYLEEAGIETRVIFSGNLLKHPAYKNIDCRIVGDLKESDKLFREGYFVGVGPHLTKENILFIAQKIKECKKK
jgi:CDP-6-deoxy-D-xylo-4-hexulose-3-dehydrase